VLVVAPETKQEVNRYLVKLRLEKPNARNPEAAEEQFRHVLRQVSRKAGSQGWEVLGSDQAPVGDGGESTLFDATGRARPPFIVPQLTDGVMASYFAGVYERDEHIRVIHDAVANHVATLARWRQGGPAEVARSHVLLKGKPAGCKTTLFERLKRWYEEASPGAERVTFCDMQTATRAGVENYLLEKAELGELADVVVFEEIEKLQPLDNLLPLVSVMGSGYVAKLNAHVGRRRELANVLVFATCNDEGVVRRWRNGAIWSRFAHKLHCPRPSRELMGRILLDTVESVGGNPEWAERAMEFAYETLPAVAGRAMEDPREIKALLDGRDRLLDGSYQRDLLNIFRAEAGERRSDRQSSSLFR
jgi:hypothetical protein